MNKNHYLIGLSESNRTKVWKEPFTLQSRAQQVFSAIWEVEAEVNNGGFKQYFYNNSTESAHFVAEALEKIGAPKTAEICKRAIATAFPDGLPLTTEAIQCAAAAFPNNTLEALGPLDEEFFSYPHNLTDSLFDFVSEHPEEFGDVPEA